MAYRADALAWLASEYGQALLEAARALPADRLTRLTRLRRIAPSNSIATFAVELLELRARARAKFAGADSMFFTPEGLEQSTGERIAAYRASRFPLDYGVLDACCGIGGDARALGFHHTVLAVDLNPAAALCAKLNMRGDFTARGSVKSLCADVTSLPLQRLYDRGLRSAFFDPSRRGEAADGGRKRLRSAEDYQPPLNWTDRLREHFSSVAVKVSPAIDDDAVRFQDVRVEFISDRGECKEAMLWFGEAAETLALPSNPQEPYYATVLRPDAAPATLGPTRCPEIQVSEIGEYVYEPDPAIIRAHLVPQLAAELGAGWIEPGVPYLTASRAISTPFATAFRVVEWLPYHVKEIQRRLRALGAHLYAVKKRGVALEPAAVQKALAPGGDRELVLILMRRAERVIAILCERIGTFSESANDKHG